MAVVGSTLSAPRCGRVTVRACLNPGSRRAHLDQRASNGADTTVAQALVAGSVPRGSMEPSIATWMDGFWLIYAAVSVILGESKY